MSNDENDLLIKAGHVFCARTGQNGPRSIVVRDGRITDVGLDVNVNAAKTIEIPNGILLPGLIDLHSHPAKSGSVFGVDPDRQMLARGVTTVLSQGDAGADNLNSYIAETVNASATRVRLAINLSRIGESTNAGCFACLENADVDACVAAIENHHEHIWGIAVNTSHHACGDTDPREIVRRGLSVAEQTGLPILYGMRRTCDWSFEKQMEKLRPGDVVTYCFRREPHCIIEQGRVHPAILAARERGILFDVGHGGASFSFEVAEAAIGAGFLPDTISTDLHNTHIGHSPQHDLPLVMSKLHAAGMPEQDILKAVTEVPATVLRLENEIGALGQGMCADLTLLRWIGELVELHDPHGVSRKGGRWESSLTIRAGVEVQTSTCP